MMAWLSRMLAILLVVFAIAGPVGCAQNTAAPAKPAEKSSEAAKPTSQAAPKPADKPLDPPVTVNVAMIGSISDSAMFVAMDRGHFKEQGININLTPVDASINIVTPLATGEVDVTGGAINAGLFNAIGRDIPVKMVADKGTLSPGHGFVAFVVRKDLIDSGQFKDVADFKGQNFALSGPGVSSEVVLSQELQKVGLDTKDLNVTTMNFPDMPAAFAGKSIAGSELIEPILTSAIGSGLVKKWKGFDEISPNRQLAVLMYSAQFAKRTEVANRFMVGYVKGLRDYVDAFDKNKNKAEIISILTKYTSVKDPAVFERITPAGLNPDGYINPKTINEDQDWFFSHEIVKQKIDLNSVIDNSFVDYALKVLGKYQ